MTQVGGGKMESEFEVSRCKLLYIEWINNKVLLYGTGNYIQYPVINHNGKIYKKNAYIHITESLCCARETNTHCKLTICQLKIIISGTLILHSQQRLGHPDRESIREDLNNTREQRNLRDMYRTFYLTASAYIFFPSAHEPLFRLDHEFGHKTSLSTLKTGEVFSLTTMA